MSDRASLLYRVQQVATWETSLPQQLDERDRTGSLGRGRGLMGSCFSDGDEA